MQAARYTKAPRRSFPLLALCVTGALLLPGGASAADGDANLAFNGTGFLRTSLGGTVDRANAVAVQADGKLVVAGAADGDFAVSRFNPTGTLDTTFSPGGVAGQFTHSFPTGGADAARDLVIQPDGKIVAVGTRQDSGGPTGSDLILIRLDANGEPDTGFDGAAGPADGDDGVLSVPLAPGQVEENAEAVALSGTDIVVGGLLFAGGVPSNDVLVARFNSGGQLDTAGFNSPAGFNTLDIISNDVVSDIEVVPGGKIVTGGFASGATLWAFAQFTVAGALDTTFSTDEGTPGYRAFGPGGSSPNVIESIARQADGKLVFAGMSGFGADGDLVLTRTDANGVLDSNFDTDGFVRTELDTTQHDGAVGVAQQADGKLLVGGSNLNAGAASDYWLARYEVADGALDTTFSAGAPAGLARTDLAGNTDFGYAFALSPSGLAYVVGESMPAVGDIPAGIAAWTAHLPPTPTGLSVDPVGPANNNNPRIKGTAVPGTGISIFGNDTCAGSPVATGLGVDFAAAGIPVAVGDNATTTFSAKATATANESGCSTSISYTEATPPPSTGSTGRRAAALKRCAKIKSKKKKKKCKKKALKLPV